MQALMNEAVEKWRFGDFGIANVGLDELCGRTDVSWYVLDRTGERPVWTDVTDQMLPGSPTQQLQGKTKDVVEALRAQLQDCSGPLETRAATPAAWLARWAGRVGELFRRQVRQFGHNFVVSFFITLLGLLLTAELAGAGYLAYGPWWTTGGHHASGLQLLIWLGTATVSWIVTFVIFRAVADNIS
jgi:hypothetical protein